MFGGKIKTKSRTMVPGSHRMESYQDTWLDGVDIEYDGEITPEVEQAIIKAYRSAGKLGENQSGYGALRWANADTIVGVDKDRRQLILACSVNLCD